MTNDTNLHEPLKRYFGFETFRNNQEAIIRSLMAGHDVFVLMPTGGGKSICYQLPALLMDGVAIVVSPLIALMKNQVDAVRQTRADNCVAHYIYAALTKQEIVEIMNDVTTGKTKLLYVSPELFNKDSFVDFLKTVKVSFIAVDEAHCISEWGHDFRPEYRKLRPIINEIGQVPIIALTATATDKVRMDIKKNLGIPDALEYKSSFNRPNLYYEVRQKTDKVDHDVIRFIKSHPHVSGIIYCLSRKRVEELTEVLRTNDINACAYHAGLDAQVRSNTQDAFLKEDIDVIVATIAFGMGIDKPDVRLVVHLDPPDSLEAYFQEAGRAGRDGAPAEAILLTHPRDVRLLSQRIAQTFPPKEKIREIYDDVAYYLQVAEGEGEEQTYEFDLNEFCRRFHHFPLTVVSAFTILERAGYLLYADKHETRSRLMMIVRREDLYHVHNRVADGDKVLTALFRLYTGLFADYVFIEESSLASACGLSEEALYERLTALNRARLLHYIPRKSVATVRYLTRRTVGERLALGAEAYETRLEQYTRRIEGVVRYCTDRDTCHSRLLLEYFDDPSAHDCGRCDVCCPGAPPSADAAQLEADLFALLADGRPHTVSEWHVAQCDAEPAGQLLQRLVDEGRVVFDTGRISLPRPASATGTSPAD